MVTILNREKILQAALALVEEGKHDRAIREYEKLVLADPSDHRVKIRIAELQTKRKQIPEAIRLYREVAEAYIAEGFFLKAVTVYKSVLRLNPSLIEINEQLGGLYEKMGLASDAVRQYDILAAAFDLRSQLERIIDVRSCIVRLAPQDGGARVKLAEALQRAGRMDEAIAHYEEYARQLEKSGGNKARLADVYEKILSHRPESQELLRNLVSLCQELGDTKRTLKWLESGKELVEKDPPLLALTARLFASQHQNETARAKYLQLAELFVQKGEVEQALRAYEEILVLLPDEEERLARRVEELRPGAMAEIVGRSGRRRLEIEKEATKKQEAEKEKSAPPSSGKPSPAVPAPSPAKPPAHTAAPSKSKAVLQRDGDAAFDLGMTYHRMGLEEEATEELWKAREHYQAALAAGGEDAAISGRLAKIEEMLRGRRPASAKTTGEGKKHTSKPPADPTSREQTEPPLPPSRSAPVAPRRGKKTS